jgi:ComEC/Rec2-related protein
MKHFKYSILKISPVIAQLKILFPFLVQWSRYPAFVGWCALSLGITTPFLLFRFSHVSCTFYLTLTIIATLFLIFVSLAFPSRLLRFLCFFSLGCCIEFLSTYEQSAVFNRYRRIASPNEKCLLCGTVISIPIIQKGKYTFIVKADSITTAQGAGAFFHKKIMCFSEKEPPPYGAVQIKGVFRSPRPREIPGIGFDEYLYCMSNNLWGTFYGDFITLCKPSPSCLSRLAVIVRSAVKTSLANFRNEEYRGIMIASFLNEKSDLSENMKTLFFNAGIYHLLALSGFNIAVLAGLIYAILFLFPLKKEFKILLALAFIWLYLLFIGFIPSLFRAVIMTTLVGVSFIFQKKNFMLNTLGIAGIAWLTMSPMSIFTPSYQLSFAATFGLITLSPALLAYCKLPSMNGALRFFIRSLYSIASVSLASFIATAPVLIYHFNQLYLFGLFANLFAVTLMAMAMWVACVGIIAQVVIPPLSAFCMHAAETLVHIMIQCAGLVKYTPWSMVHISLPYPEIYLLFFFCMLGFLLIKKEFRLKYIAAAFPAGIALSLLCIGMHMASRETRVTFLNIKNSRLAAIKWPDNRAWIIATGPETPPSSAYQQVLASWKSQFTGCSIEKVILPGWKRDAVHFLEPIFINEKNADVICCDSLYARDEDFNAFVRSFKRRIIYKQPDDSIAAWNRCACKVISRKDGKNKGMLAFIARFDNSVVFIPELKEVVKSQ